MRPFVSLCRAGLLALFVTAACDGGGTSPARPASLVAITATTQSAVVASPVPVPPAVLVSDGRGRALPGVQVTFAVTGGNGTVAAAPVLSDAGGIAVAAGWVTGVTAVENVLTASVSGVAAVQFRAGAAPGPAAAVEKAGGDGQTAAAGTRLADSISVRVVDQYGNGVPDVLVNFTATRGTLSASRVATGAQGHARVSLVLPPRPGAVEVLAGTGSLNPQGFGVTVTAGPPAAITRIAGNGQAAQTGTAVPVAPTVRVSDSFGNPVPGRAVTFVPAPGNGVVTGGAATTSSDGLATVGRWTLGEPGANRLIVRVAGLDSLEFTATALEPCGRPYALLSTISGELLPNRCTVEGRNAELYAFTVASTQCLEFRMNSSFDPFLFLLAGSGAVLAFNDDGGGGLNSLIRARLSPGSYLLGAAAYSGGAGPFQLTSSVAPEGACGSPSSSAVSPGKTVR